MRTSNFDLDGIFFFLNLFFSQNKLSYIIVRNDLELVNCELRDCTKVQYTIRQCLVECKTTNKMKTQKNIKSKTCDLTVYTPCICFCVCQQKILKRTKTSIFKRLVPLMRPFGFYCESFQRKSSFSVPENLTTVLRSQGSVRAVCPTPPLQRYLSQCSILREKKRWAKIIQGNTAKKRVSPPRPVHRSNRGLSAVKNDSVAVGPVIENTAVCSCIMHM